MYVEECGGTAVAVVIRDPYDVTKVVQMLKDRIDEFEVLERCNVEDRVTPS